MSSTTTAPRPAVPAGQGPQDRGGGYTRGDDQARSDAHERLYDLAALPEHDPARPGVRARAIVAWLPLANDLAHRFAGRGEPIQDLVQTATVGLIKAVDRFDVARGNDFPAFAVPTIVGEVKRYFRDQTWDVHVPRRLQELRRTIAQCTEELAQQLGRTPSVAEIADHLGLPEQEIREGMQAASAYSTSSLDAPAATGDEPGASLADLLGEEDPQLLRTELRLSAAPAVAALPERQQRILHLRFFRDLTQDQIARQIGISQMHVSRLLNRTIDSLRRQLREQPDPPAAGRRLADPPAADRRASPG